MKKNTTMITILTALLGCALTIGSLYKLFKDKANDAETETSEITKTEMDITNQKVAVLKDEIDQTKERFEIAEEKIKQLKMESQNQILGQNIPIVEISDVDLAEKDEINKNKDNGRITYNHQIKFSLINIGNHSLKEVLFSIKDIYNDPHDSKTKKKQSQFQYMGKKVSNEDVGSFNTIEINTLNLKTKKQSYVCNLPVSFGVGDYYFDIIVEWSKGFYQMHVDVEELNGKLKYRYKFYDMNGKELDFKSLEENIKN